MEDSVMRWYWIVAILVLVVATLVAVLGQISPRSKYIGVWQKERGLVQTTIFINEDGSGIIESTISERNELDYSGNISWIIEDSTIIISIAKSQSPFGKGCIISGSLNEDGDGLILKANYGELLTGENIFYRQTDKS